MSAGIIRNRVTQRIPKFTYMVSGVDKSSDTNYVVLDKSEGHGNWKIYFKQSGTLTFTSLGNAGKGIDVFLVGGGGGGAHYAINPLTSASGGGSGYTLTDKTGNIKPVKGGNGYSVSIGAAGANGGGSGSNGGNSSAFGLTASGGKYGTAGYTNEVIWASGGNGGSGGGRSNSGIDFNGGTKGGNGSRSEGDNPTNYHGKGQITNPGSHGETGTTEEFGVSGAKEYAKGGGISTSYDANSGNGGCVYYTGNQWETVSIAPSSGIVVIRNHR